MSNRVQVESKALEALIASLKTSDKEFLKAARKLIYTKHTRGAGLWAIQNSDRQDDDDFDDDDDDEYEETSQKNDMMCSALMKVMLDAKTGPLKRFLCEFIIQKYISHEPKQIMKSIKSSCGDLPNAQDRLITLMLALGPPNSYQQNLSNISAWISTLEPQLRYRIVPTLIAAARTFKTSMPASFISKCEEFIQNILMKASPVGTGPDVRGPSGGSSSWKKFSGSAYQQVQEPDGSVSMDYFTVLNLPSMYSIEQQLNQQVFSTLYTILSYFHGGSISSSSSSDDQKSSGTPIEARFNENIILYCRRVIDQSNMKQISDKAGPVARDESAEVASVEALRLLDLACTLDRSQAEKLIPQMKRNAALLTNQSNGHIFLNYLTFFFNHSTTLLYDAEPLFKTFFDGFISNHYTDQIFCYETLEFCLENVEKILSNTLIFPTYFPSIFKIIAWHTFTVFNEFYELLPALISESSFVEVLNFILNLPLLTASLEAQQARKLNEKSFGYVEEDGVFRALNMYLLRSKAGSSQWFSSQESRTELIQQYFQNVPLTERVFASSRLVLPLLERFFDVMLDNGSDENIKNLLVALFRRYDSRELFPNADFCKEVQGMMLKQILSILEVHPEYMVALKEPIIKTFTLGVSSDLVLALIWAIGELLPAPMSGGLPQDATQEGSSDQSQSQSQSQQQQQQQQQQRQEEDFPPRAVLNDYCEALETFVFVQVGDVKAALKERTQEETFVTRVVLVAISALTKFAARWQFFSSRVVLCLSKVARVAVSMNPVVLTRVNECLAVLKQPTAAVAVLGRHRTHEAALIDVNSPLPYILHPSKFDPSVPFEEEGPLHPYSLRSIESGVATATATMTTKDYNNTQLSQMHQIKKDEI